MGINGDIQIKWNKKHTRAKLSNGIKIKLNKNSKEGSIEKTGNSTSFSNWENTTITGTSKKDFVEMYHCEDMHVNLKGGNDIIHAEGVYNSIFNFGLGEDRNAGIFGENNKIKGIKEIEDFKKLLLI